jgi:hypothetical protein
MRVLEKCIILGLGVVLRLETGPRLRHKRSGLEIWLSEALEPLSHV